jgi:hypothetical protein
MPTSRLRSPNPNPNPNPLSWTPIPDPTLLTTEQSNRLREEMYRAVAGLREILEARLLAQEDATDRFREGLNRDLNVHVDTIKSLFEGKLQGFILETREKFTGVMQRFTSFENRVDTFEHTNKAAIDAAFNANQKVSDAASLANDRAIGKSETATKEKIDALQALLTGSINDIRGQIAALTSRLDRSEGQSSGATDNTGKWMGGAAIGISALTLLYLVMVGHPAMPPLTQSVPPAAVAVVPLNPNGK